MWTRRELLIGGGAALLSPRPAVAAASERRLLVVVANGGWDPTFALDPKLGIEGIAGPMADTRHGDPLDREVISTVSGVSFQHNPRRRPNVLRLFGGYAERLCVINGIWVGPLIHYDAMGRTIAGTTTRGAPDVVTQVGASRGAGDPLGSVDLSGLGRFGEHAAQAVRFGRMGQLRAALSPEHRPAGPAPRGQALAPDDRQALQAYLQQRNADDPRSGWPGAEALLAGRAEALERAERLRQVPEVAGPTLTLSEQLDAALDLFASGACIAALAAAPHSWDSHYQAVFQHYLWDDLCADLIGLLEGIDQRGLRDTLTVAVLSEMGRTPHRNAEQGTDHWPHTSALLFGAGVRGGQVLGATDDQLLSVPVAMDTGAPDPSGAYLRPENLLAGLLTTVDVDPGRWLPGIEPFQGAWR